MEHQLTSYDSVLYPSYTHLQTHPDRLGVIGSLLGLNPAPIAKCRVLELGCNNGSNLIPMAWGSDQSEFVGIDLASVPVAQGQQLIKEIGMSNVRLIHGDIMDISAEWGKFDYILAHGIYSWVPPQVQKQVLNICRNNLSPHGIAFVSYNALPGCHMRKMLREMMFFHVRGCQNADERVNQALALVKFLGNAQTGQDEYRLWMKSELDQILGHDRGHMYHDELAELNEPLYFGQFMERATAHGLQYLGEADYFEMSDYQFNPSTRQTLQKMGSDRLLREQYLDFLKCRRFRQTLLCHKEAPVRTEPLQEKIEKFLICSAARPSSGSPNLHPGVNCTFEMPKGAKVETDLPIGKAALTVLESVWPMHLAFEELLSSALQRMKNEGVQIETQSANVVLREFLYRLHDAGAVEFRISLPKVARSVTDKPKVFPVARAQVHHGSMVASLFHMAIKVEDEIGRSLLSWLDGSLDREALLKKLWDFVNPGGPLVKLDVDNPEARRDLEEKLDKNLEKLARLGLFVA